MFVFAAFASAKIPTQYLSLVEKAKQRGATNAANAENFLEPKKYDFNGIRFTLNDRLIGPSVSGIEGYAFQNNVLALICPIFPSLYSPSTIFADPDTQTFHRLGNQLGSEGFSYVFAVVPQDPTEILHELTMNTALVATNDDKGYKCAWTSKHFGATCNAWYGINWVKGADKPTPRSTDIANLVYYAGAIGEATATAQIIFHSFKNIELTYDFAAYLKGGLGLEFQKTVFGKSIHVGAAEIPVYGKTIKILGVTVGFQIAVFIDFGFNQISMTLPEKLIYYRSLNLSLQKSGSLSTKDGAKGDKWDFKVTQEVEDTIPRDPFAYLSTIKFEVDPELTVGLKAEFQVGSLASAAMKIGGTADLYWKFTADIAKCKFPYLYGTLQITLDIFVKTDPVKLASKQVVAPYSKVWRVYDSGVGDKKCMFSKSVAAKNAEPAFFLAESKLQVSQIALLVSGVALVVGVAVFAVVMVFKKKNDAPEPESSI